MESKKLSFAKLTEGVNISYLELFMSFREVLFIHLFVILTRQNILLNFSDDKRKK
jgi:hypothetical protein